MAGAWMFIRISVLCADRDGLMSSRPVCRLPCWRPLPTREVIGISSDLRETDSLKTKDSRRVLDTEPSVCWTERETTDSKANGFYYGELLKNVNW